MTGPYLALDWGLKKIGWATGDDLHITTTPHPVFWRKDPSPKWRLTEDDKKWLRQIIDDWQPRTLVLGLPLGLRGEENNESRGARELASDLHALYALPVELVNEALSTWESRGKKDEDSEAAAILLKDLWSQQGRAQR